MTTLFSEELAKEVVNFIENSIQHWLNHELKSIHTIKDDYTKFLNKIPQDVKDSFENNSEFKSILQCSCIDSEDADVAQKFEEYAHVKTNNVKHLAQDIKLMMFAGYYIGAG